MKLLVVGSGGREHALAWRLARDAKKVFLAPGNAGARLDERLTLVEITANDYASFVEFAAREKVDLVVVGPDQALADGLVDQLQARGIPAFGPTRHASEIEWSKAFAKEVMSVAKIPTARYSVWTDPIGAKRFLRDSQWPTGWALKADGLALGKGVVVTQDLAEAESTVDEFMVNAGLGEAGKRLVIEERLIGREVSAFYICDGKDFLPLAFACDYKQIFDGGRGPNTGGMGAYTPVDWLDSSLQERIATEIVRPLLRELAQRGRPFQGTLFAGLMITADGPKVIEFNARFGDPETQAILPLVEGNFAQLLLYAAKGELHKLDARSLRMKPGASVHVVLAAHGYPGTGGASVRKDDAIKIHPELLAKASGKSWDNSEAVQIFFAGVKQGKNGLVTNGGRVLGITAWGRDRTEARSRAYQALVQVTFSGMQRRGDIGADV